MSNKREGRKLHEENEVELELRASLAHCMASWDNLRIKHWKQIYERHTSCRGKTLESYTDD